MQTECYAAMHAPFEGVRGGGGGGGGERHANLTATVIRLFLFFFWYSLHSINNCSESWKGVGGEFPVWSLRMSPHHMAGHNSCFRQ